MGWQARVEIMRNVADIMEDRLFDLAALMAYEVGKSRLEALGDVAGDGRADPLERRRDGQARGVPHPDERHGRGRRLLRRPASVRRVGRHQPVQLPDGAVRRAVVGRARRRQRRGAQAVEPGRADGLQALRVLPRRRRAGRRVPPGDRPRCATPATTSGSTPTWAASRSPARTRWAWTSTSTSRTSSRSRSSARWAARTPRSSRRAPTWTRRRTACCVRRSGSADRSARRARACSWSARSTTTSSVC